MTPLEDGCSPDLLLCVHPRGPQTPSCQRAPTVQYFYACTLALICTLVFEDVFCPALTPFWLAHVSPLAASFFTLPSEEHSLGSRGSSSNMGLLIHTYRNLCVEMRRGRRALYPSLTLPFPIHFLLHALCREVGLNSHPRRGSVPLSHSRMPL